MPRFVVLLRGVNVGKPGRGVTARNWATVSKLADLLRAGAATA